MRVLVLLLIALGIAGQSCSSDSTEVPPLTRDQMVAVMIDVYLAEARASLLPVEKDSAYRLFTSYQDTLLHRKGIADTTLTNAYNYYMRHPDELEVIYDAVIDSLNLREQRQRNLLHGGKQP